MTTKRKIILNTMPGTSKDEFLAIADQLKSLELSDVEFVLLPSNVVVSYDFMLGEQLKELANSMGQLAKSNEIMCDLIADYIQMDEMQEELPENPMGGKQGEIRRKSNGRKAR